MILDLPFTSIDLNPLNLLYGEPQTKHIKSKTTRRKNQPSDKSVTKREPFSLSDPPPLFTEHLNAINDAQATTNKTIRHSKHKLPTRNNQTTRHTEDELPTRTNRRTKNKVSVASYDHPKKANENPLVVNINGISPIAPVQPQVPDITKPTISVTPVPKKNFIRPSRVLTSVSNNPILNEPVSTIPPLKKTINRAKKILIPDITDPAYSIFEKNKQNMIYAGALVALLFFAVNV